MKLFINIKNIIELTNSKSSILIIIFLMIINMSLEFLGLGIMIPILTLIIGSESSSNPEIINLITNYFGNPDQKTLLIWSVIFMLGFYFFKTFFQIFINWKIALFNGNLTRNLQTKLFNGYLNKSYLFHLDRNSSELLYNIQSEINYLSHVTQAGLAIIGDMFLMLGIFLLLVLVNPSLAIFTLLVYFSFGKFLDYFTKNKLSQLGKLREIHENSMFKNVLQALGGIKDVILYAKRTYFSKNFDFHANKRKSVFVSQGVIMQIPKLYYEFLSILIIAVIILFFVFSYKDLTQLMPTIGLFMLAAIRIMPSANKLSTSMQTIKFNLDVVNRVYNELKMIDKVLLSNDFSKKSAFDNVIEIKNLNFSYPKQEQTTINNFNFSIKKGETIGFIGESGSGKSTLIDILLGILKLSSGEILVDGNNIYNNLSGWQAQIGYVSQSVFLLDDTIKSNVAFGISEKEIDENKVLDSLKSANLNVFISSLENGINTIVGERGSKLSGGQRQRIGLARALYNNPSVLVLDEATSALDNKTESEVMKAIIDLKREKTILIIAHRLSTISNCDRVYSISKNKIELAPQNIGN